MTKTVTSTGLVRIECHGQVWFDTPGYTEIVFPRLHIEHKVIFDDQKNKPEEARDNRRSD